MSNPSEWQQISSKIVSTLDEPFASSLLTLDKALASQTQTSAQLNISNKSLSELAAYAQSRLDNARISTKKGLQEAKDLQKELQDLERRVRRLMDKAREQWPVEYYSVRDEMDA